MADAEISDLRAELADAKKRIAELEAEADAVREKQAAEASEALAEVAEYADEEEDACAMLARLRAMAAQREEDGAGVEWEADDLRSLLAEAQQDLQLAGEEIAELRAQLANGSNSEEKDEGQPPPAPVETGGVLSNDPEELKGEVLRLRLAVSTYASNAAMAHVAWGEAEETRRMAQEELDDANAEIVKLRAAVASKGGGYPA